MKRNLMQQTSTFSGSARSTVPATIRITASLFLIMLLANWSPMQAFSGISNGTFESSIADWTIGSGTSYGFNHNIYVAQGAYSVWIARSRGSSQLAKIYQDVDAKPAHVYALSFWAGTHNPSYDQKISMIFYSKNGSVLATHTLDINHNVHPSDLLQSYSLSATAPTNTDFVRVQGTTNGDYLKIDDVVMTESGSFPVEWLDFAVTATGEDAVLSWATASELNSSHFEVQRSVDGTSFERMGEVTAAGNSQQIREYEFRDRSVNSISIPRIYYRLRQIDLDGSYSYSNVIEFRPGTEAQFQIKAYPNPVQGELKIDLDWVGDAQMIQISQPNGKVIYSRTLTGDMGSAHYEITTSSWPAGIYFVSMIGTQTVKTDKIIKR